MKSKNAYLILSLVVIFCSCACHVEHPTPNACANYGGFTVALAEATVNCTETIGPQSFSVDEKGRLQKTFSHCTGGTAEQQTTNLKAIDALLALQDDNVGQPQLQECLAKRYVRWSKLFVRTGLETCPVWRERKVLAEGNRNTMLQLAKTQPRFQYISSKAGDPDPKDLKPSTEEEGYVALQVPAKSTVVYTISYPEKPKACEDVAVCAAQCAAFLPGFVVSAAGDQLVADPSSWYGDLTKQSCPASGALNPWCPPFVHAMAITVTTPESTVPAGDLYGHPNRGGNGERCVRFMPDSHGGAGTNYITDLNQNGTRVNALSKCGN